MGSGITYNAFQHYSKRVELILSVVPEIFDRMTYIPIILSLLYYCILHWLDGRNDMKYLQLQIYIFISNNNTLSVEF